MRILRLLAVRGRMYTRQLLRLVGAWDKYGVETLKQLAALGLVKRQEGQLCDRSGKHCTKVVWNSITREGLDVLRELGELSDVEEVLAEEHVEG